MPKQMLCPSCKNAIIVDSQTLATAERIQCPTCNASFKLKKKAAPLVEPKPEAIHAEVMEVVDALPEDAGPLDLGSMNFNNFGAAPAGGVDNSFDPLASPIGAGAPVAGAGAYAPKKIEVPNKPPREPMSVGTKIVIALSSVGAIVVLGCGTVGYLFVRAAMGFSTDQNNMRLVALAMHNYESAHRRLPAVAARDAEGKPVFSWAVGVAPYVDDNPAWRRVDHKLMLPWNAPGNEVLQGSGPAIYRSARGSAKANERNVFVLTAPSQLSSNRLDPIFVQGRYPSFGQIADGMQKTILAIMLTRHSKPWAEPSDLTIDEAFDLIQKEPGVVLVAMADGKVIALPTNISRENFQALATSANDDSVQLEGLQ